MKKISLLLAGVMVSTLALASGPESPKSNSGMAVVKTNATSYKLIYKGDLASNVKVKIYDGKNQLVFSETIKKSSGFARPYNFSSLADGEYTIRIDNGSKWLTETVDYRNSDAKSTAHLTSLKNGRFLLTDHHQM